MISVIIATHKRPKLLEAVLSSFLEQEGYGFLDFEILVVDNNSLDNTEEVIKSYQAKFGSTLKYFFEGKKGKTFALNTGLKYASGDIIAFTDDDVKLSPNWLLMLQSVFEDKSVNFVSGRIVPVLTVKKPLWFSEKIASVLVEVSLSEKRIFFPYATGANMAMRKSVLIAVGGFSSYPQLINEDTVLSSKITKAGFSIIYEPQLIVYHYFQTARLTKAYFRRWYFLSGKTMSLLLSNDDQGCKRRFLGIPFFRYKGGLKHLFSILKNIADPKEKFYHELQFINFFGFCFQRYFGREKF